MSSLKSTTFGPSEGCCSTLGRSGAGSMVGDVSGASTVTTAGSGRGGLRGGASSATRGEILCVDGSDRVSATMMMSSSSPSSGAVILITSSSCSNPGDPGVSDDEVEDEDEEDDKSRDVLERLGDGVTLRSATNMACVTRSPPCTSPLFLGRPWVDWGEVISNFSMMWSVPLSNTKGPEEGSISVIFFLWASDERCLWKRQVTPVRKQHAVHRKGA